MKKNYVAIVAAMTAAIFVLPADARSKKPKRFDARKHRAERRRFVRPLARRALLEAGACFWLGANQEGMETGAAARTGSPGETGKSGRPAMSMSEGRALHRLIDPALDVRCFPTRRESGHAVSREWRRHRPSVCDAGPMISQMIASLTCWNVEAGSIQFAAQQVTPRAHLLALRRAGVRTHVPFTLCMPAPHAARTEVTSVPD